jgi:hypothetical protein
VKQAARFTGQAWPEIIPVALRASLKPYVLSQLCSFNLIHEAIKINTHKAEKRGREDKKRLMTNSKRQDKTMKISIKN